jgi:hypothetical protein
MSEASREVVISPLKRVRKLRQDPAHKVQPNKSDPTLVASQISLINEVVDGLWVLRRFLQTHPDAQGVDVPDFLDEGSHYRM